METSPRQSLLSLEVGVTRSEAGDISGTRYGFYPVVGWGWEGPAGRRWAQWGPGHGPTSSGALDRSPAFLGGNEPALLPPWAGDDR